MLIFISYSSANRDLVRGLVEVLEGFGHEVWFDQELSGGHIWWDEILDRIRRCDLFIFALSPESFDSYPCKLEYTYGHALGKRILPVLLNRVNTTLLPPILSEVQFVDYQQQDTKATIGLGRALNMLPPPLPLPNPLPASPKMPVSPLGRLKDQIDTPSLSFEEQTAIVSQLKELLARGEKPENVLELFEHLQDRSDLFAVVDRDINAIVSGVTQPKKVAQKSSVQKAPRSATPKPISSAAKQPGRVRRFLVWLSRIPGWLWRNLIVKPIVWQMRFLRLLLLGPITLWGVIWRFGLVFVLSDIATAILSYPYTLSGRSADALIATVIIMLTFLVIRFLIRRWIPFRPSKSANNTVDVEMTTENAPGI